MVQKLKKILRDSVYEIEVTNRMTGCGRGCSPFLRGMLLPDQNRILIKRDISLDERTRTLIHELLHEAQPGWVEDLIETATNKIYDNLSEKEKGYFMFFVQDEPESRPSSY